MPKPADIEALTKAAKSGAKDKVDFTSKRVTLTGLAKQEAQKQAMEELRNSTIWTQMMPVSLDYKRLEDLFENKVAEVKVVVSQARLTFGL